MKSGDKVKIKTYSNRVYSSDDPNHSLSDVDHIYIYIVDKVYVNEFTIIFRNPNPTVDKLKWNIDDFEIIESIFNKSTNLENLSKHFQ
jgi:hypothetical protein